MYCQNCGAQSAEGQSFCGGCGRALVIAPVATDNRVARHIRLLSILWMALGALWALAGLGALLAGKVILPQVLGPTAGPHFVTWIPTVVTIAGWGLLVAAAICGATGVGLYNHDSWGRPLALIMGFLVLLKPPFGTALGIYTLWILLPTKSDAEYQKLARAA